MPGTPVSDPAFSRSLPFLSPLNTENLKLETHPLAAMIKR
jgi:hypothetical protein